MSAIEGSCLGAVIYFSRSTAQALRQWGKFIRGLLHWLRLDGTIWIVSSAAGGCEDAMSLSLIRLQHGLFFLARTRPVGWFVREVFAHMSFAIPVQRLRETSTLLAFHHPRPSYPLHILLVPKRNYRSLLDVEPQDSAFLGDLLRTVQDLVREFGLEQGGYRLVANGGSNQDVPILHFHLISDTFGQPSKTPISSPPEKRDL
jgi:histidine triad (HIT) family protein